MPRVSNRLSSVSSSVSRCVVSVGIMCLNRTLRRLVSSRCLRVRDSRSAVVAVAWVIRVAWLLRVSVCSRWLCLRLGSLSIRSSRLIRFSRALLMVMFLSVSVAVVIVVVGMV